MPTLPLDDGTLWYDTFGEGQPLVFVHGGWLNSDMWAPQVDRYASEYRVVTLDLRGHGQTGATDRRRYSVELFADDLERLLDHLDADRPILCGLSLGSMVVQEYLDRHPDAAAGAILAGPIRSMPPVDLPSAMEPMVSPFPALGTSLAFAGPKATFRSMLAAIRASTSGPWLTVDDSVRAESMDAVDGISSGEFRKIFGALYEFDPPTLSGLTTPTLVLHGDREAALVKRQGERLAESIEDGTLTEIPEAGHLVNRDNPGAFNAACSEFLASLTVPAT